MRCALSSSAPHSGCALFSTAAAPATCGVAIEVPFDAGVLVVGRIWPGSRRAAWAATMSTPGAVMSGLIAPSPVRGPRLENVGQHVVCVRRRRPLSAASAVPGDATVP